MKHRQFVRMIEAARWSFIRHGAEHDVYGRGQQSLGVPRHGDISPGVQREWRKKNDEEDKQ